MHVQVTSEVSATETKLSGLPFQDYLPSYINLKSSVSGDLNNVHAVSSPVSTKQPAISRTSSKYNSTDLEFCLR